MWQRILKVLDERKARIANEFQQIDETKRAVELLRAEFEKKMASSDAIGRERIQQLIDETQKVADGMKKEAQHGAQKILENARAMTARELSQAKQELKDEIIDLVLKTTEQVMQEKLTPQEDRKIIETFLNKMDRLS
jgi:F-type H+-transporting ATPase subunit b